MYTGLLISNPHDLTIEILAVSLGHGGNEWSICIPADKGMGEGILGRNGMVVRVVL